MATNSGAHYVMKIGIAGQPFGQLDLMRRSAPESEPVEGKVCYVQTEGGRLSVGMFKAGQWRDHRGQPLNFAPAVWFEIGLPRYV